MPVVTINGKSRKQTAAASPNDLNAKVQAATEGLMAAADRAVLVVYCASGAQIYYETSAAKAR